MGFHWQRGQIQKRPGAPPVMKRAGFHLILASSVGERDGMGLELTNDAGECVAEVFQDDINDTRTFTVFGEQRLPIAIEWLLAEARTRL